MEEQLQHRTTTSGRLRFELGGRTVDISLPAEVPLVDLLPAVLPHLGAEWVEQGADHEGWVAQRLGEAPLDEDRTLSQLGLMDGETVHLLPRGDQLAPIDYDDVVHGVAEQVRTHPGAWSPHRTRWMLRIGAIAMLLMGIPLLRISGAPPVVEVSLTGAVTLVLLVAAALVARGTTDTQVATILVGVATAYAASTGALLLLVLDPVALPVMVLTCAAASALVALTLGLVAVADAALLFAGAVVFAAVLAMAGLIGSVSPATAPQASAIALAVTLIAGIFVPSASFRLSGLTLPLLPTSAEELAEDIEPVPHRLVVDRGVATVGYANALYLGLGGAQTLLLPVVVLAADMWSMILSLVMALLLFLRSRHPDGLLQRWAFLVPAGVTVVVSLVVFTAGLDVLERLLAAWLPALAVGVVLLLLADRMPGRRMRPYWGRAVDIFESLTAISVIPILLQVLGVYAHMRGLAG